MLFRFTDSALSYGFNTFRQRKSPEEKKTKLLSLRCQIVQGHNVQGELHSQALAVQRSQLQQAEAGTGS